MPGRERIAVVRSAATAILLLLAGALLAWLCLGTSLVNQFIPAGRPSMMQMAVGVGVWGFAIIVPAGFGSSASRASPRPSRRCPRSGRPP